MSMAAGICRNTGTGPRGRGRDMDKIIITDLLFRCTIGLDDEERRERQDVVFSISLSTNLRHAGRSDKIEDTVDYRALKKKLKRVVEESSFRLVEALAERVAAVCLEHPAVEEVTVRVEKPTALRFARSVGVEITRRRE